MGLRANYIGKDGRRRCAYNSLKGRFLKNQQKHARERDIFEKGSDFFILTGTKKIQISRKVNWNTKSTKKEVRRLFIEYEYLMAHFSEDMEPQFQRYSLGLKVLEMRKSTPKDAPKPP